MNGFSMFGKFVAHPGQRDALAANLLRAAAGIEAVAGCQVYVVSVSDDEPDAVWVMEVWRSEADHAESLRLPETRELIAETMPLIASISGGPKMRALGGHIAAG